MSDFISELRREVVTARARHQRRGRRERAARALRPSSWAHEPRMVLGSAAAVVAVGLVLAASIYLVMAVRPEPAKPPAPNVVARFTPAGSLDAIAAGFGSAWLDDPNADRLLRVDPRTRKVTARIRVRGSAWVSIGSDAVWAVESGSRSAGFDLAGPLLRIDPHTNRVVARIPLRTPAGERFTAWSALVGNGVIWVIGPHGALRVDARANRVTGAVKTDASGYEVVSADLLAGDLWMLRSDGRLLRFDARGVRKGVAPAPVPVGSLVAAGRTFVVVGEETQESDLLGWRPTRDVVRVDPATGTALCRTRLDGRMGPATFADGRLWIETADRGRRGDRLVAIDPRSGRTLSTVHVGEFDAVGLARVGAELWMITPGGRVVVVRP
jgi:hypothetical protein